MSEFSFSVEWVAAEAADRRLAQTAANLNITIDGTAATRLLDSWSKTVVDEARVPLFPLVEWLVYNWWRIHAEPAFEAGATAPASWRLAHDLPSVGKGYVWPRLRFASDGEAIVVSAKPTKFPARWEPVTHLAEIRPTAVSIADFDSAVTKLVSLVLDRLQALKIDSEPLAALWRDVSKERANDQLRAWRTWEGRLGYDPDEAPSETISLVMSLADEVGYDAMKEIAPATNRGNTDELTQLLELSREQGIWATLPKDIESSRKSGELPWDFGHRLGRLARKKLHVETGPITDGKLTDMIGIPSASLEDIRPGKLLLGLGVRNTSGKTILHFRKKNRPGRRFEAARFIADNLVASPKDTWLPLTDLGTARQKIQRSFAAELLMPIGELVDTVGESRSSGRIEDAADYYGVSPLAVRSHLANHGYLQPEEVLA